MLGHCAATLTVSVESMARLMIWSLMRRMKNSGASGRSPLKLNVPSLPILTLSSVFRPVSVDCSK